MSRKVDTAEYMGMLRKLIGQGHRVSIRVAGNSMSPFLKHGRDTVFFAAPDSEIKKGDIVFYTRPNGQYIMHRVCRVNPDGSLDISGDAQCVMECGVPREAVFARVVEAERDGKLIAPGDRCWDFFSGFWVDSFAVRPLLLRSGSAVMRIIKSFRGESDGSGQRKKE